MTDIESATPIQRAWPTRRLAAAILALGLATATAAATAPVTTGAPVSPTQPTLVAPSPVAPVPVAPQAPSPAQRVPGTIPIQIAHPLHGIWQSVVEQGDPPLRETTRLELRPDGVAIASFLSESPNQQKRKPVVSTFRYAVVPGTTGVFTVDFDYTGADREVQGEDARRRVQLTVAADVLQADDGSRLARVR